MLHKLEHILDLIC
ncbi:hypothetical protein D029_4785A, partial [Vibrio parahaemolyticus 970107]